MHAIVDIALESLAGVEMYKLMKNSGSAEVQRRILVAKWLYTNNFLGDKFPGIERFIPGHKIEDADGIYLVS